MDGEGRFCLNDRGRFLSDFQVRGARFEKQFGVCVPLLLVFLYLSRESESRKREREREDAITHALSRLRRRSAHRARLHGGRSPVLAVCANQPLHRQRISVITSIRANFTNTLLSSGHLAFRAKPQPTPRGLSQIALQRLMPIVFEPTHTKTSGRVASAQATRAGRAYSSGEVRRRKRSDRWCRDSGAFRSDMCATQESWEVPEQCCVSLAIFILPFTYLHTERSEPHRSSCLASKRVMG